MRKTTISTEGKVLDKCKEEVSTVLRRDLLTANCVRQFKETCLIMWKTFENEENTPGDDVVAIVVDWWDEKSKLLYIYDIKAEVETIFGKDEDRTLTIVPWK